MTNLPLVAQRILEQLPPDEWNGRVLRVVVVAELTDYSVSQAWRGLQALNRAGIVQRRGVGANRHVHVYRV